MAKSESWDDKTLYFYCEFIGDANFPDAKRINLQNDNGIYFITNDFTIYQIKAEPEELVNKKDTLKNFSSFNRMLDYTPPHKIEDLLEFHLDKFDGDKLDFLKFVYHRFKGMKTMRGDEQLPPSQRELILIEWCQEKLDQYKNNKKSKKLFINSETYVNQERIKELELLDQRVFDLSKLVQLCNELNLAHQFNMNLTKAILLRTIINHIPPIFGKDSQGDDFKSFSQVANNYSSKGNQKSFKKVAQYLEEIPRNIADSVAHSTIREKDSLPNENQVDFISGLDYILMEIYKILKK